MISSNNRLIERVCEEEKEEELNCYTINLVAY